ncbi:MAG: hypothetical protein JSW46_01965 [Gemmatimonadota bacterium]|nr:MAG: hypothetical protein JSW46_01965 [Gemmatimonadota bacterium]
MSHSPRLSISISISISIAIGTPGSATAQTTRVDLPTSYISGYARTLNGEELRYHSPLPYVERSLLVRSLDRDRYIEWRTSPAPDSFEADTAVFVIMAGIDVHQEPRRFDLFVNGEPGLTFRNPREAAAGDTLVWQGERGLRAEFRVTLIDKYDDAMGFIFLHVPRALLSADRALEIRVAGESAGVPTWFMIFKEPMTPQIGLQNAPALLRGGDGNRQIVRVDLLYLGDAGRVRMESPIGRIDDTVGLGHRRYQIPVLEVERETEVALEFQVDEHHTATTFAVAPVRRMDVYLIHHTHLDIGYTHHQDEVERLQWSHMEDALRLGAASESYPEEAHFVWHPEGLWAVESYLATHGDEENERLREGIRRGWIHLDGMYANLLTGIATSEGLMRSLAATERLGDWSGVPIESAMLSDIPGFTWGLVPALAQHGVRYLSIGPNFGHRIGYFSEALGDRPFYWESPSGDERLLTWVSGAGYATFHSGLGYSKLTKALDEVSVFKYVEQLAEQGYPYDVTYLRYNIGSDNGPPDPDLADAVRAWNERYVSPRLVISNVTDVFRAFEERYGDRLPVHRGDLTGHWEDGAASSARETALVRRAAEELIQTEALSALLGAPLPPAEVYAAWRNVVLYYEHTWGSWNSVSEPQSDFTLSQWEHKKAFADSAVARAARLRDRVLAGRVARSPSPAAIEVINTASWPRTDVVILSAEVSRRGDRVLDQSGRRVPSQRLSTGELAFLADEVPAFGARRFLIEPGAVDAAPAPGLPANVVANDELRLEVDTLRGTVGSLVYRPAARELVGDEPGLNQYIYVAGRDPADAARAVGPFRVRHKERGPLVSSLEVIVDSAPGAKLGVRSEFRLYTGVGRVDIINTIDKSLIYDPEAVLYRYPFDIADPVVRVDVPWGSFRLEDEQLPGSSKNYMSLQRWAAIQGDHVGVTFASIDAPLIQFGTIRTDAIVAGWLEQIEPSATLFSYPMNNYWETNYKAAQDGPHEFRYSLRPHRSFDEAEAERFARGIAQPFIAVPAERDAPGVEPPFTVEARRAVVTSLQLAEDGSGFIVRLYNPSQETDTVTLSFANGDPLAVYRSDVTGVAQELLEGPIELGAYEILTLRVTGDSR